MRNTMNELTKSKIDRDNILNNHIAMDEIEKKLDLPGVLWENAYWFTKEKVANIFHVDIRTIERIVENNKSELHSNGYRLLTPEQLSIYKLTDINVGQSSRNLVLFSFRAVLNVAMLLTSSERAKEIRSQILDIVLGVLTEKSGGHRLYINQRDPAFLSASFTAESERKIFTKTLHEYVDMGAYKYEYFTNRVYKCIFKEDASTYQKILRLHSKSKLRDTMYSEILTNIAAFERAIAEAIKQKFNSTNQLLTKEEVDDIITFIALQPAMKIYFDSARRTMATLDNGLRDAYHGNLEEYITSVNSRDFERFLGDKSKSLQEQIEEHRDIFLRLKDK